MRYRLAYLLIFGLLLGEALAFAPPQRPDQTEWVMRLLAGDWAEEEPSVVALFQAMGVWPLAMAALLAPRLRRRPVPLWPFALGSMALGAFSLLPGLVLGGTPQPLQRWQRWMGSRALAVAMGVAALGLLAWALLAGSLAAFVEVWRTEQFVHVMSHDFLALWATSIVAAHQQRQELGARWIWTVVPLLGVWALRAVSPVADDVGLEGSA